MALRETPENADVPVSVEWTAPFGQSKFHIGIHNIPGRQAEAWMDRLRACTAKREDRAVHEMLGELNSLPSVLIVLESPPLEPVCDCPLPSFNRSWIGC